MKESGIIAKNIRALREARNLTITEFAKVLGVGRVAMHRYEGAEFLPRLDVLRQLFLLAVEKEETRSLAPAFLGPIANETGLPVLGLCVAALMQAHTDPRKRKSDLIARAEELLK